MPPRSFAPSTRTERARLIYARLSAQGLALPRHGNAGDLVHAMGAMQGQDLPGLLSSIALRLDAEKAGEAPDQDQVSTVAPQASDSEAFPSDARMREVLRAFDAGEIVRGYPMRGTVFAMAARDARWMTELCAKKGEWEARRRRSRNLSDAQVEHALNLALEFLAGKVRGVTRAELLEAWKSGGVETDGGRGYHLITYFMASGHLIYGPIDGAEQRIVEAATWLPDGTGLEERFGGDKVTATAALLERYLASHGPATLRDFAWWTKLPLRQIRAAALQIGDGIEEWGSDAAGETLFCRAGLADEVSSAAARVRGTFLLPGFDELVLGYPDRLALMTEQEHALLVPGNNGVFRRGIVRGGRMVALWRTVKRKSGRALAVDAFGEELSAAASRDIDNAFAAFPHHDQ